MNQNDVKVSVIVPAYNVETYITECINSIIQQSYQNLEIIIVEDGSKDNTPFIVDHIEKSYQMVRVIHQNNAGVSQARNVGIDAAKGDYIVFVDSDDFLDTDFIVYMLGLVKQTGADFCLSKNCYTKRDEIQTKYETIEVLDSSDGTALLLSPAVMVGCWNKIFKKSLLDENNIRFKTELFYGEGLDFITTVSQHANRIGVGNLKYYYYRRNNAFSATTRFNINSIYNGEKSLDVIENNLIVFGKSVETMMILHRSMYCIGAVVKLINNNVKKQYYEDYKRWIKYIRSKIIFILKSDQISFYRKILLLVGCFCPKILAKMDSVRRKKIERNSVSGLGIKT